jgi:hypothetical protein
MAKLEQLDVDPEPIRPADANCAHFDLRLGHEAVRFAVRTADPQLIATLRGCVGLPWVVAIERYGPDIIALSPHRVVSSPAGRVEVYAPIPPPGGRSPQGSHTHLLPGELELGRELPLGVTLPPGLMPATTFHPNPDPDFDVSRYLGRLGGE